MAIGIIGIKSGMTRVFQSAQVKSMDLDSYEAVQLVHGSVKAKHLSKPQQGHFGKVAIEPGDSVCEFRMDVETIDDEEKNLQPGDKLSIEQFFEGQTVDVTAMSKGKGFAGVIKRWNFQRQDMSHGNSLAHRAPGSIGQCQTPGKVFKGKKMAGHMGNARVTIQNLQIVKLVSDRNVMLIKGSVPGPTGGCVEVRPATKGGRQSPVEEVQEN